MNTCAVVCKYEYSRSCWDGGDAPRHRDRKKLQLERARLLPRCGEQSDQAGEGFAQTSHVSEEHKPATNLYRKRVQDMQTHSHAYQHRPLADTCCSSRVTLVSVNLLEVPVRLSMVQCTCCQSTRLSMAEGKPASHNANMVEGEVELAKLAMRWNIT